MWDVRNPVCGEEDRATVERIGKRIHLATITISSPKLDVFPSHQPRKFSAGHLIALTIRMDSTKPHLGDLETSKHCAAAILTLGMLCGGST